MHILKGNKMFLQGLSKKDSAKFVNNILKRVLVRRTVTISTLTVRLVDLEGLE